MYKRQPYYLFVWSICPIDSFPKKVNLTREVWDHLLAPKVATSIYRPKWKVAYKTIWRTVYFRYEYVLMCSGMLLACWVRCSLSSCATRGNLVHCMMYENWFIFFEVYIYKYGTGYRYLVLVSLYEGIICLITYAQHHAYYRMTSCFLSHHIILWWYVLLLLINSIIPGMILHDVMLYWYQGMMLSSCHVLLAFCFIARGVDGGRRLESTRCACLAFVGHCISR